MTEKWDEIHGKLDLVPVSEEFELDYPSSFYRGSTVASKNGQIYSRIEWVTVGGVVLEW